VSEVPNYENLPRLSPMEHVRLRPGMYFGGTDQRALHQYVWVVLENAVDQAQKGFCNRIEITLYDHHKISISDNGTGIPVDFYKDTGRTVFEIVISENGGKSYDPVTKTFPHFGGLRGVGLAGVNAVSAEFAVQVKRDGFLWQQHYAKGKKQSELEKVSLLADDEQTGTTITFSPDFSIFEPNEFNYDWLYRRLHEIAAVVSGITTTLIDKRATPQSQDVEFSYNSLVDYVAYLNRDYAVLHSPIQVSDRIEINDEHYHENYNVEIEIALQYAKTDATMLMSFCNTLNLEGGKHMWGFYLALSIAINKYAFQEKLVPNNWYFAKEHLLGGLAGVINIWHPHPHYESQSHIRLVNPELEDAVFQLTKTTFEAFTANHPDEMWRIVEKCLANKAQREQRRYGR
jgi:DNA gyrase subunit B